MYCVTHLNLISYVIPLSPQIKGIYTSIYTLRCILGKWLHFKLGLSDTTVLAIYRDILKVSISQYFVINYRDTMPVHYCH